MPSPVTDVHVHRVSFVKRASTRDPRDPSQPRRVLLWKSEDADDDGTPPYVETAVDRQARRLSKACDVMHEQVEAMRRDGTPTAVIRAHEQSYGRMHAELVALHDPAAARLLKGENPNERETMSAALAKRAIGTEGAKPAASDGLLTLQEIEDRQQNMSPLLADLHDDIARMRRAPETPPHVLERHERARAALHREYRGLDEQRGLHEAAQARRAESGAPVAEAAALRKSDSSLSPLEALKAAMLADPDAYFAQSGTARPAPAAGVVNAPAREVKQTPTEGLDKATDLARAIQQREGVSSAEAFRRAMRDPAIAAQYAAERGGAAAA